MEHQRRGRRAHGVGKRPGLKKVHHKRRTAARISAAVRFISRNDLHWLWHRYFFYSFLHNIINFKSHATKKSPLPLALLGMGIFLPAGDGRTVELASAQDAFLKISDFAAQIQHGLHRARGAAPGDVAELLECIGRTEDERFRELLFYILGALLYAKPSFRDNGLCIGNDYSRKRISGF